jgi:hypothetical protein
MSDTGELNLYEGIRTTYGPNLLLLLEQRLPEMLLAVVDTRLPEGQYVTYGTTSCQDLDEAKKNAVEYANRHLGIDKDLTTDWVPYKADMAAELARLGVLRRTGV